MSLKRDNWTNEEVINIINGMTLFTFDKVSNKEIEATITCNHNDVVRQIADHFRHHFASPPDSFGALSLDTETGEIFHTGKILPQ